MGLNGLSMKGIFGRIVQRRIAHATDGTGGIQCDYQAMMGACVDGSFLARRMGRSHLDLRNLEGGRMHTGNRHFRRGTIPLALHLLDTNILRDAFMHLRGQKLFALLDVYILLDILLDPRPSDGPVGGMNILRLNMLMRLSFAGRCIMSGLGCQLQMGKARHGFEQIVET